LIFLGLDEFTHARDSCWVAIGAILKVEIAQKVAQFFYIFENLQIPGVPYLRSIPYEKNTTTQSTWNTIVCA
jgi:hypothetical protein